jgi:hypothetical protein
MCISLPKIFTRQRAKLEMVMPRQACKTGRRKDQPKAGRTFTAFLECFVRGGPSWKMPVSKIFQASVVELTKAAVVKSHVGCSYMCSV